MLSKQDIVGTTLASLRIKPESHNTALSCSSTVISKDFLTSPIQLFSNLVICFLSSQKLIKVTLVLPQISPFSFGDEELNLDETVAATCIVTKGDLPVSIWWTLVDDFTREKRNLTTSDGLMIMRSSQKLSVLNIDAVKARHRGNYTCYASNKAGVTQHSAYLAINGLT